LCQFADGSVEGGREQQRLARSRSCGNDPFDILDETHVQHAVRFVKDQYLQLREVDLARAHVVDQATRRGHQDLGVAAEEFHLLRIRHAAEDGDRAQVMELAPVLLGGGGDLQGKLAGGRQDQHLRLRSLEALARVCRPAVARTGGGGRPFLRSEEVQRRQHEGRRLAGTGLRGNHQVAAREGGGYGLLLDRRRFAVAGVGECLQDGRVKADFCKSHISLSYGCAARCRNGMARCQGKKATPTNEKAERQTLFDQQESAPISTKALCQDGAD
jgi:hypothetical protein